MTTVAIDGPAGAGKSSVARAIATTLGFRYLDTGAMYRGVALAALDRGVDLDDEVALAALLRDIALEVDGERVILDGRDVSTEIRRPDVTTGAARAARHVAVRAALAAAQRALARGGDVVMEGRDIGSEVLPDADVKIYLTAALDERALRRARQSTTPLSEDQLEVLRADLARRDESDRTRAVSPLVKAPDAIVIDSTGLSQDEVVASIVAAVRRRAGRPVP
jgi:CMP/dCMP kinase